MAGLIERLARTLAVSSPELFLAAGTPPTGTPIPEEELVQMTEAVINEAVQHDAVVMVGRGAQAYLAERSGHAVHVYIVAPRATRIAAAMQRLGISKKEATRTVDEIDGERRRYVETHYHRQWHDPTNYHLVINTGLMSHDDAGDLVVHAARMRVADSE